MFVSNFTKWEWLKVSLIAGMYNLNYRIPSKIKKMLISMYILLIILCIIGIIDIPKQPFFFLAPFIVIIFGPILGLPSHYLLYSKTIILFYSIPSPKKQDKYSKEITLQNSVLYGPTCNFYQHVILKSKEYDMIIETKDFIILFYRYKTLLNGKRTSKLIHQYMVIKKSDNKEILNRNEKSFNKLCEPYCKRYKKMKF